MPKLLRQLNKLRRYLRFEALESRTLFASFSGLGEVFYPANSLDGSLLSADGSAIAGNRNGSHEPTEAAIWTRQSGWKALGDLEGGTKKSVVEAISEDGRTVVGRGRSSNGQEAFYWSEGQGRLGLGDLPGGIFGSFARGVSADGRIVAGDSYSSTGPEAFRWTATEGMIGLGDLPGGIVSSKFSAISSDGNVIIGESKTETPQMEVFRWTAETGMVGLGFTGLANGVSANGEFMVGRTETSAFRWSHARGLEVLDDFFSSEAYRVSADGSTVIGLQHFTGSPHRSFIWKPGQSVIMLGESSAQNEAAALSNDGSVVVGYYENKNGGNREGGYWEAFYWTASKGLKSIKSYLMDLGVRGLEGWQLWQAIDVSADGRFIVGEGMNPKGAKEGWIAEIPLDKPDFGLSAATARDYDQIAFGYELSNVDTSVNSQLEIKTRLFRSSDTLLSDDDTEVPIASVQVPYTESHGTRVAQLMNGEVAIAPCDPRDESCIERPYLILSLEPEGLIGDDPANNVLAFKPDTDGDALLDSWEIGELDLSGDGVDDLNLFEELKLSRYGAKPEKKDVFVEMDYMQSPAINQQLSPAAIQIVAEAFADAPVGNPDGTTGIILHVDAGSNYPMNPGPNGVWDSLSDPSSDDLNWGLLSQAQAIAWKATLGSVVNNNYSWDEFNKMRKISPARQSTFRYAIAAHGLGMPSRPNTSGIANSSNSQFIVSLGGWTGNIGTTAEQAGTFMHELGHTFGLSHDGQRLTPSGAHMYQPNYLSVMNYSFQVSGIDRKLPNGQLQNLFDYSRFTINELPVIKEASFDESLGVVALGSAASYVTRFCNIHGCSKSIYANQPVDWDGDNILKVVRADLNGDGSSQGDHFGTNDWLFLNYSEGTIAHHAGTNSPAVDIKEAEPEELPAKASSLIITSSDDLRYIVPGETTTFSFTLANSGRTTEPVDLSVLEQYVATNGDSRKKLISTGLPADISLAPGESVKLSIEYTAPTDFRSACWINIVAENGAEVLAAKTFELAAVDRAPLLIVEQTDGTTVVSEDGRDDAVRLSLTTQPNHDVYIDVKSADTGQLQLEEDRFVFTSKNWNQPQLVKLRGVNDRKVDGRQEVGIEFQRADGSDPMYWQAPAVLINVVVLDSSLNPEDVNADGYVSPIDALLVINYLNSDRNDGPLTIEEQRFDVNDDKFISPIDALLVINVLNLGHAGTGELSTAQFREGDQSDCGVNTTLEAAFFGSQEELRTLKRRLAC